jgi:hypothetical protein
MVHSFPLRGIIIFDSVFVKGKLPAVGRVLRIELQTVTGKNSYFKSFGESLLRTLWPCKVEYLLSGMTQNAFCIQIFDNSGVIFQFQHKTELCYCVDPNNS